MASLIILNLLVMKRHRERARRHRVRLHYRQLRDATDPFNLPEDDFKTIYKLNKENAKFVLDSLQPYIRHPERCNGVPVIVKVFATLQFLGSGSYQTQTGISNNLGLSQAALSHALNECLSAFITHLMPQWIKFPTGRGLMEVKQKFLEKFNFPDVVGVIDGTHIAIVKPPQNHPTQPAVVFCNNKGSYSINVLYVCDADLKIRFANARYPGSCEDFEIWEKCGLRRHLEQLFPTNPQSWLIGDSDFPLEPWLLTPIGQPQNAGETSYNSAHKQVRNTVVRCIRILKNRFRCLSNQRPLYYNPTTAAKIFYSCVMLHNLCLERNDNWNEDITENTDETSDDEYKTDPPDGSQVRSDLITNHFS